MSERKLATIRRISEIRPIEGADRIVVAIIDGWQVVTQKDNNFKPGDFCIYFEIDSLLPVEERFEFLRKSSYVTDKTSLYGEGFRLKTIRLRGEISQGLILPLDAVFRVNLDGYYVCAHPNGGNALFRELEDGQDITELLGVKKFERILPANLAGNAKGNFPSFIPKTDEERIQNYYKRVNLDDSWLVTEKLDGTSFTAYIKDGEFGVCSRNLDLQFDETNTYWQVAMQYNLQEMMSKLERNIAVQGEIVGPGIQKNPYKLDKLQLRVFNIYDIDEGKYLNHVERYVLCRFLSLDEVPYLTPMKLTGMDVNDILMLAEGKSILNAEVDREGLVFENVNNPHISFKAISNAWLLEGGD